MVIPKNITLSLWAASLIIDFPNDDMPILKDEKDWKLWGNFVAQGNSFLVNNAPFTGGYDDWRTWADNVYKAMLNF